MFNITLFHQIFKASEVSFSVSKIKLYLFLSFVTQSYLTLCDPMDCSTPDFPVFYQLPELAQTHASESGMPLFPGDTEIILTITGSDFTLSYSLDFNCHNMSQTAGKTNKISLALFWLTLQREENNYEKQQHLIFYRFTEPLRYQYIDICIYIYIYIFLWVYICVCTHTFIHIFFPLTKK